MSNVQSAAVIETTFNPRRILVPIDGSTNSRRAVEAATAFAKTRGSELFLVMIVPEEEQSTGPPEGLAYEFSKEKGESIIYETSKIPKNEQIKVTGKVIRSSQSVVAGIIEFAEENKIDLIVIGTRGLGSFKRLFLGSVSDGVVRHAHCNVLVVR
jgi:nucleotide-binding universal stress UspA family protein